MLEALILDYVERLSATVTPIISDVKSSIITYGDASVSASVHEFIKNYMNLNTTSFLQPAMEYRVSNQRPIWLAQTARYFLCGRGNPAGNLTMSFDPSNDTFAVEDTIRALEMFQEDQSGVVWAVSNKSGYYGLWKRTGVGAWTQVLTDTGITSYLGKWTTGIPYHVSSTGNWYSLAAGTASLTTNPGIAAGYTTWLGSLYSEFKQKQAGYYITGDPNSSTPQSESSSAAYSDSTDAFYFWKWPDRTRIMPKPKKLWDIKQTFGNNVCNITYIPVPGSNYWLGIAQRQSIVAGQNFQTVYLQLINLGNGTNQYLGSYDHQFSTQGWYQSGGSIQTGNVPMMAYMSGGTLRIYHLGQLFSDSAGYHGCQRYDITARITI